MRRYTTSYAHEKALEDHGWNMYRRGWRLIGHIQSNGCMRQMHWRESWKTCLRRIAGVWWRKSLDYGEGLLIGAMFLTWVATIIMTGYAVGLLLARCQ